MTFKSYDWVNDEEARYDLAAASVVVLFTERTMKTMKFDEFYPFLKDYSVWNEYTREDRNKLQSYLKCLKAAVELAHKKRTGQHLNIEEYALREDYFKLYDLILRVYSRLKSSGNTP